MQRAFEQEIIDVCGVRKLSRAPPKGGQGAADRAGLGPRAKRGSAHHSLSKEYMMSYG